MAQKIDKNDDVLAQAVASMDIEAEPSKTPTPPSSNNLVSLSDLIPSTYKPNRYAHPSAMENNGAFVQIMSHNCNDSANVLGCIRLPVSDPNEVQYYLATRRREILVEAVAMLDQHFKDCQSATAVLEDDLTVDDYSLTFMVASVNEAGKSFNNGRKEGGLWMLNYPSYLTFTRASFYAEENPNLDTYQLTINAYIHLNEPHRRQRAVIKKHLEDSFAKAEKTRSSREVGNKGKRPARDVSVSRAPLLDHPDTSNAVINPGPPAQPTPVLSQAPEQPQQPLQSLQQPPQPPTTAPASPDQPQPAQAPVQPPVNGPATPVVPQPVATQQAQTLVAPQIQPLMSVSVPAQQAPNQQPQPTYYQDNAQQPQQHPPGYPQPQYQHQQPNQRYQGSPQQRRRQEQQPFQPQPFQQQPFQQFQQQQPFPQQPMFQQQQQFVQPQYQGQQQYRPRRSNRKGPYDGSRSASAHAPRNYNAFPPMPQGTQPANPNWSGPVPVVQG